MKTRNTILKRLIINEKNKEKRKIHSSIRSILESAQPKRIHGGIIYYGGLGNKITDKTLYRCHETTQSISFIGCNMEDK